MHPCTSSILLGQIWGDYHGTYAVHKEIFISATPLLGGGFAHPPIPATVLHPVTEVLSMLSLARITASFPILSSPLGSRYFANTSSGDIRVCGAGM